MQEVNHEALRNRGERIWVGGTNGHGFSSPNGETVIEYSGPQNGSILGNDEPRGPNDGFELDELVMMADRLNRTDFDFDEFMETIERIEVLKTELRHIEGQADDLQRQLETREQLMELLERVEMTEEAIRVLEQAIREPFFVRWWKWWLTR